MTEQLGLIAKWECPACQNMIKTQFPAWSKKILKASFEEPNHCPCGRKGNFRLLDFSKCTYEVKETEE